MTPEFRLKSELSTSKGKRFKNEVLFCQKSQNPNIVAVVDTGAAKVGKQTIRFYVMPYYPKTLRSLIKLGIKPDQVLPLFSQILNGVEFAHLSGVNHRDLKPENILYDEDSKKLAIADFGAAEFTEDELYTLVETKADERIGNFLYSAPEQRNRGGKVDHRCDIYALGLILNEMFTGEVPAGSGHRLIASVSPQHSYLDPLVEAMRRQSPQERPDTIAILKGQLVARGNEFIEFQRLDRLRNAVVPTTTPSDPSFENPVKITNVDYLGDDLIFSLEPRPSVRWIQVFQNPTRGYTSVVGYPPQSVRFVNNTAIINMPAYSIESGVSHFKEWVNIANQALPALLAEEAREQDARERERLRKAAKEEETRQQALKKARQALGF